MPKRVITPEYIADHIRRLLKDGGSAPHSAEVQWFFKEEVQSRGWYTAELRKVAVRLRRTILREQGLRFLVEVANQLFQGSMLEEKICAVMLLENQSAGFGDAELALFGSWLDRVSSWAGHDSLAHNLIAPIILSKPSRCRVIFRWAKSSNRWRRRAACVTLIRGAREKKFFREITRLSNQLLRDEDDMVQKGLGWLLRETAKAAPKTTTRYLMKIRNSAPRLVLRTACETLPIRTRKAVLSPG